MPALSHNQAVRLLLEICSFWSSQATQPMKTGLLYPCRAPETRQCVLHGLCPQGTHRRVGGRHNHRTKPSQVLFHKNDYRLGNSTEATIPAPSSPWGSINDPEMRSHSSYPAPYSLPLLVPKRNRNHKPQLPLTKWLWLVGRRKWLRCKYKI